MPIRFKCPSCQKGLQVKDHMAGKKAACPVCKKPLSVPVPTSKPADVESFAAQALADPPPGKVEQPAKATQTIDFTCPYCDAEVHVGADKGGKQEPCPSCKRILRVPLPDAGKAKDWRTVKAGPSAALSNVPAELEGAWGSTTSKARVSRGSLEEADAIVEDEEEPVGVFGWIRRVTYAAVFCGAVALAFWGCNRQLTNKAEKEAIAHALAFVDKTDESGALGQAWRAEIYRAAGEFYVGKGQAKIARDHFTRARLPRLPPDAKAPLENDLFLGRLALSQVELGGSPEQVANEERQPWKDVQSDLFKTLDGIRAEDARRAGLRSVVSVLLRKGEGTVAIGLATQMTPPDEKGAKKSVMLVDWVAVFLAQNQPELPAKRLPPPDPTQEIFDQVARLAYAEGKARKGQFTEAEALVQAPGATLHRLEAAVCVAVVALERADRKTAVADALPFFHQAVKFADELKDEVPPWLRLLAAKVGARTDVPNKAQDLLSRLPAEYRSWAELELVEAKLRNNSGMAEASVVEEVKDKESLPRALAWEAWARHNVRLGKRNEVDNLLQTLGHTPADDRIRPFLYLGIALGTQDADR
jgi:hypothetical protein